MIRPGCLFVAVVTIFLRCGGFARGQTEYFAVFMEGKKAGYSIHSRVVADGKVTTTDKVRIEIGRGAIPVAMEVNETSIETTYGKVLGFEVEQNLAIMAMKITGTVNEQGKVKVTSRSMGLEQTSEIEWPKGALMAEGVRLLELEKGLKPGVEYTAKIFSASSMKALDTKVRIGAKRNVDLLGRVAALTEVKTTIVMPDVGEIISTGYVDDEFRLQKNVTPMMGMKIELIACAKEFALGKNDVVDFIDKMVVASPAPLENVREATSVSYHLVAVSQGEDLKIPSTDNQSVHRLGDGKVAVIVEPVKAKRGSVFPYTPDNNDALEMLKPTRYVQSDSNEIIELARKAVGQTQDAAEAVKKIESFVGDYIRQKDFSVGYASAAEVAASRMGDCSEHAVLTAALCRAVGIPARVVCGLVYADEFAGRRNIFGGHAWTEAYVGSVWVGLDATRAPDGFDAGHITLATGDGEPSEFFSLVNTFGRFKIEKIAVVIDQKKKDTAGE